MHNCDYYVMNKYTFCIILRYPIKGFMMKTNESNQSKRNYKELELLLDAKCSCSACMAQKNRIKQQLGEKQYFKACESITHSHVH